MSTYKQGLQVITIDPSNIEISAKYVKSTNNKLIFTVCKKRNFGVELKVEPYDYGFTPSVIYDMMLNYEKGVWRILEVWHAV